jgi:hypothetical protein
MKPTQPWWRFGHVWLVISGPAVVVVASFVTLYLAIKNPDPVQQEYYGRAPAEEEAVSPQAIAPAELARNHAQTGIPARVLNPKK